MSGDGKLVLVTGGTGFISSHAVKAFLENGYRVRTTCRDPDNREKAKALYTMQVGCVTVPSVLCASRRVSKCVREC